MTNRTIGIMLLNLIVMTAISKSGLSQTYDEWTATARQGILSQNHPAAFSAYMGAFKIHKGTPSDLYNAACAASRIGKDELALDLLQNAIDQGYIDTEHLIHDVDLNPLHDNPKWRTILVQISDKNKTVQNNPLKAELEEIREKDQSMRLTLINSKSKPTDSLIKSIKEQDEANQARVKNIIAEHGWLGPSEIGELASSAIFLVVQHSSLSDQKAYIDLLRNAVKNGQAKAEDLALMEDRIAVREGREQVYGSQIGVDEDSKSRYVFPLIDPEKVDDRRRSVGLIPMADYLGLMNLEWDINIYKQNIETYKRYQANFLSKRNLSLK